jgi:PAS domain S-box-containing protein
VIDGLFAFVGVLTPGGVLVEANRAALQAAGLRPEDVIGLPFEQTYWWSYSPEAQARLRDAVGRAARGESCRFDALNRVSEGRFITVDFMLAPLFDERGRVTHLIPSGVDITERKQAEERIRQQAALLDVAHDAILVRDLEDRILYWNRGAERLYGWTAEEALGRQADELLFGEPSPQLREAQRALLKRGEWSGETHQVTKDGRDIIVESRWTLVRYEGGAPRAKLVVNTDVTERRRLETELLRASHLSLIGELAAGLAHEIKNPLAGIQGAVDILIRRRERGDPEVELLEDVRHAVGRIDETVLALLQRARPRPPRFAAASLDEAAHRAVLLARHHAARASSGGRQVSISFEPPPEPVVLPIDAAQIEDAVLNLILNAVEAVGGEGRVVVSVRRDAPPEAGAPAEAVIEVSDTGRGIDEENLMRLFSPFYTTTEGGTGLGLPSVRRIAQAHGGRVEVSSEPGRGSTFTVHLPLPAGT